MNDKLTKEEWERWFNYIKFTKESTDYLGNRLCGQALEEIALAFIKRQKITITKEDVKRAYYKYEHLVGNFCLNDLVKIFIEADVDVIEE